MADFDYYSSWNKYNSIGYATNKTQVDTWVQLQREMAQSFNEGFFSQITIEAEKTEKIKNQNVLLLLL